MGLSPRLRSATGGRLENKLNTNIMKTKLHYRDRARLLIVQIVKLRKVLNSYGISRGDVDRKIFLCGQVEEELGFLVSDQQFKEYIRKNYYKINELIVHRQGEKRNTKVELLEELYQLTN